MATRQPLVSSAWQAADAAAPAPLYQQLRSKRMQREYLCWIRNSRPFSAILDKDQVKTTKLLKAEGYRWSHGQYTMASCTQESSTFFVILGFTMLVLLVLLALILIIACFTRRRPTNAAQSGASPAGGAPGNQQDCVVQMDGSGQFNGKNFESVKCVIMAGEDKPTFLAHPVMPFHAETHEDDQVKQKEEEPEAVGETSKQQQHQEEGDRD
ncbi:hypothetical protein R1sor_019738 [Riccia sorocarpa]|uniref:Uncharacterized protein n=1 Tax=Riccia sorocarpa TaxID=122646 RepID=A0ABD3IEG9_9MARC